MRVRISRPRDAEKGAKVLRVRNGDDPLAFRRVVLDFRLLFFQFEPRVSQGLGEVVVHRQSLAVHQFYDAVRRILLRGRGRFHWCDYLLGDVVVREDGYVVFTERSSEVFVYYGITHRYAWKK